MRFNIHGYQQNKAIELNLNTDELLILRHFEDFVTSGRMETLIVDGKMYYWILYKKFLEDLPILGIDKKRLSEIMIHNLGEKPDGYEEYIQNLKENTKKRVASRKYSGVLKVHIEKNKEGSRSYFTFTPKYYSMKMPVNIEDNITTPVESYYATPCRNITTPVESYYDTKDYSIKDYTIRNNKKENIKEKNKLDILINNYTSNLALRETILDFINMRKEIKAKMTHRAIELMLNKLDKLSKEDEEKIEILNQSIVNSWKGIFEIKGSVSNESSFKKINGKSEKFKDYDFSFRNDTEGCEPTGDINF